MMSERSGVKFATVLFPVFNFPLDNRYPFKSIHRRIRQFMHNIEVPHLDLLKAFRSIPHERLEVIPWQDAP
jgi:hypothetical protein